MSVLNVKEIYKYLDAYVVGNEDAKKTLAQGAFLHILKRLTPNNGLQIKKSHMLITGPSGTGKTYLLETLTRYLDLPLIKIDASSLSNTGFVGNSVSDYFKTAYETHEENIEQAVVFIDELDKLTSNHHQVSAWKKSTQYELLKLVEGSEILIDVTVNQKQHVNIDTTNMLFVLAGNFPAIRQNRKEKQVPGFVKLEDPKIKIKKLQHELEEVGIATQLIGRISLFAETEQVSREALERILRNPNNGLIEQYKKLFEFTGSKLKITKADIKEILDDCQSCDKQDNSFGARHLQQSFDKFILKKLNKLNLDSKTLNNICR